VRLTNDHILKWLCNVWLAQEGLPPSQIRNWNERSIFCKTNVFGIKIKLSGGILFKCRWLFIHKSEYSRYVSNRYNTWPVCYSCILEFLKKRHHFFPIYHGGFKIDKLRHLIKYWTKIRRFCTYSKIPVNIAL
jgi:hypothetical protein